MTLLGLVVVLVIVGVALWLINTYVPMAAPIKTILNIVVIWLLQATGLLSGTTLNRPLFR